MSFTFADPRQLWLEISPEVRATAWRGSEQILAPGARWQVYLNQLCVQACLDWVREEIDPAATAFPGPVGTGGANLVSWEVVTGSCIRVGGIQLVVIPTDTVGQDELLVPQEWIDIPSWAADYYLAVKVNPEEGWVEGWGYATQRQLKVSGMYDTWARCYSLDEIALSTDINALWTAIEYCPAAAAQAVEQTEAAVQAELSAAQAESLITRLASNEVAFPRLSVPFAQWGALLRNEDWWQRLCAQRFEALRSGTEVSGNVTLSQCLQGIQQAVAAGWQSIDATFGAEAQQLAFGFRQGTQAEGRQAKVIQIGPDNQSVRLVLLWQLETEDDRLAIRAQLYPAEDELYVPSDITFALVSDQDEVLQSIQSGEENNYIQLKRFKCPMDYAFGIEIQLGEQRVTERFLS